jgi:hypothetical protein
LTITDAPAYTYLEAASGNSKLPETFSITMFSLLTPSRASSSKAPLTSGSMTSVFHLFRSGPRCPSVSVPRRRNDKERQGCLALLTEHGR